MNDRKVYIRLGVIGIQMIEWEKSAKLHNLTVDELKVYFEKRPGSNIKILVMCKKCKKER